MIRAGLATQASVFHCHDLNTLAIGVACKRKAGGSLVYDSHELHTERNRMSPTQRRRAVNEEGRLMPEVDALIVASPTWIDWIRTLHGTIPEHSVTILNTLPLQKVEPESLHRALDLTPDARVMVYQGSIQENRGIEPAIDAVTLLDGVVLVIIGYGYHRPFLESLVDAKGLGDRVKFFGPLPNDRLLRFTASADIGLANIPNSSASYNTSLPNKLFEYIMAGVPVIGSEGSEIGRFVRETGIGLTCDPEVPWQIAERTRSILDDARRFLQPIRVAQQRSNWETEERNLVTLYEALSVSANIP